MKSFTAVVLALAAAANAVKFTNVNIAPKPGQPLELTWDEAEGPVTITLKGGESGNLKDVEVLAGKSPPVLCTSSHGLDRHRY